MPSFLHRLPRRRGTILIVVLLVLIWVLFLDSHSVLNRVRWHRETEQLRDENRKMEAVITQTKEKLARRNEEKEIERIARESYGMRRDGETVYRVEDESD